MLRNIFDIKKQYADLYTHLGFDKEKISQEQRETMFYMFVSGFSCLYGMLNDLGEMPQDEGVEILDKIRKQLDEILSRINIS